MANAEHLNILSQGVDVWNKWRTENQKTRPNLEEADLSNAILPSVNFDNANLNGAAFYRAALSGASFVRATLQATDLMRASLDAANLTEADLTGAHLDSADLFAARLYKANLTETFLHLSKFTEARLDESDFKNAMMAFTVFAGNDLSKVRNLETVKHVAPSYISIDNLYLSKGNIPVSFLRGCGVPDEFIAYLPSLIGAQQAIQFYSCFISYSSRDEEFARRLYSRMRDASLRVWFAPEDVRGGEKLREQIDRAIQLHDRLLVVLSEDSLGSKWVKTEIRRAMKAEKEENRRKLFPIRLVSYERLLEWEWFDAATGEDLAQEVREYFIPDFSHWKEHDSFEAAFDKLLKDLRAAEGR